MKEISREKIQNALDDFYNSWDEHRKACDNLAKLIPKIELDNSNHVFMQPGDGPVVCFGRCYNTPITAELITQLRNIKSRKYRFAYLVENSI